MRNKHALDSLMRERVGTVPHALCLVSCIGNDVLCHRQITQCRKFNHKGVYWFGSLKVWALGWVDPAAV